MELDVKKLQIEMAKKEMNVKDLANASGVSANSISCFFSGRRCPGIKSLGKLANGLGVDVTDILKNKKE